MKMTHIITIEKAEITKSKFNHAQIALGFAAGFMGKSGYGIATDSSTHYEFWLMDGNKEVAEKLKYFLIGFLNMPYLA